MRAAVAETYAEAGSKLFLDLRDTAVTRLALAGCTVAEIRAITGHSMQSVHQVLAHYLALALRTFGGPGSDVGIDESGLRLEAVVNWLQHAQAGGQPVPDRRCPLCQHPVAPGQRPESRCPRRQRARRATRNSIS